MDNPAVRSLTCRVESGPRSENAVVVNVPASLHGIVMALPGGPMDVPREGGPESKACRRVQGLLSPAWTRDLFEECASGHEGKWALP